MAARRKKQSGKIKFELTKSGVAGIGVVFFCLFLWMFLFGVWAGQSILKSTASVQTSYRVAADIDSQPVTFLKENKKKKPE